MAARNAYSRENLKSPILQYIATYTSNYGGRFQDGPTSSLILPQYASQRMTLGIDIKKKKTFIGIQHDEVELFSTLSIKEIVFMRQVQSNNGPEDFVIFALEDITKGEGRNSKGDPCEYPLHLWYPVQKGRLDILAFSDKKQEVDLLEIEVSSNGAIRYMDETNPEQNISIGSFPLIRAGNWKNVPLRTLQPAPSNDPQPGEGLPDVEAIEPAIIGNAESPSASDSPDIDEPKAEDIDFDSVEIEPSSDDNEDVQEALRTIGL